VLVSQLKSRPYERLPGEEPGPCSLSERYPSPFPGSLLLRNALVENSQSGERSLQCCRSPSPAAGSPFPVRPSKMRVVYVFVCEATEESIWCFFSERLSKYARPAHFRNPPRTSRPCIQPFDLSLFDLSLSFFFFFRLDVAGCPPAAQNCFF